MKRLMAGLLACVLMCGLFSCANSGENVPELTQAETAEDFEALYTFLRDEFPYAALCRRQGAKIDADSAEASQRAGLKYYEKLDKIGVNLVLSIAASCVSELSSAAKYVGHLAVIGPQDALQQINWAKEAAAGKRDYPYAQFSDKKLVRTYESIYEYMLNNPINRPTATPDMDATKGEASEIIEDVIEKGRIVRLRIPSFRLEAANLKQMQSSVEKTKERLAELFDRYRDYEHVIFDITGNQGGTLNFTGAIIDTEQREPDGYNVRMLCRDGKNNDAALEAFAEMFGIDKHAPAAQRPCRAA